MKTPQLAVALVATFAFACGGQPQESPEAEGTSGAEAHGDHHGHHGHHGAGHEHHDEHHADLPSAVRAFHDRVAHHWHGDRSADAVCPDAADLQQLANAAADEQQAHAAVADEARAAAQALVDTCAAEGHAGFVAALERLHHALHGLMEAAH